MAVAKLFALIDDIAAVQGDVAVLTEACTHQTRGCGLTLVHGHIETRTFAG